ncbi:MAG: hypothetical protein HY943_23460 [Gammaproteobacteria bacterium]|nr:hypothetical protein [Gammaproteobacteria bacterium]
MDISTPTSLNSQLAQLGAAGSTQPTPGTTQVGASAAPPPPPGPAPNGGLADAVAQALSQIDVGAGSSRPVAAVSNSGESGATGASSSSSSLQALATFLQELMASVRDQGTQIPGTQGDGGGNVTSAVSSRAYRPPDMQADLQNLARAVSERDSGASSTASAGNAAPSALQQRFDNLVASLGGKSNGSTTLASFLQSTADNLPPAPSARGNVVSTSA